MQSPGNDWRIVLERLNERLLKAHNPGEIETSLAELEDVARNLRSLELPPTVEVAAELTALRGDLRRAAQLVESGLVLQEGWARMLATAVGGYTASGDPAPLAAPQHVLIDG